MHRFAKSVALAAGIAAGLLSGCAPTVKVEPSDKPIVINLNVKIEQDVRVHVEEDAKALVAKRPDLF